MPGDSIRDTLETVVNAAEASANQGADTQTPITAAPAPLTAAPPASGTPAVAAPGAPAAPAVGDPATGSPAVVKKPEVDPTTGAPVVEKNPDGTPKQNVAAVITGKAPGTWTPAAREHWASMPQEVRDEVIKREKEVSRAMTQSTQARQFQKQFQEVIQPFMGFIQAEGSDPLKATQLMMQTAALFRTGSVGQKVNAVASIIKQYGVDLEELDKALAGEAPGPGTQQVSNEDAIQRAVDARLAPHLQRMNQSNQQMLAEIEAEVDSELSDFAEKHEFYEDLKDLMADIMEVSSRRGVNVPLTAAYESAILQSPSVRAVIEQRKTADAAKKAHQVAAQARAGAFSVSNSAETGTTNLPAGDSIRDAISRSIEHHSGRA